MSSSPSSPVLRLRGVRKRYLKAGRGLVGLRALLSDAAPGLEAPWVLDGIDLEIPAGQSLGIVGVNGAGKTTLLKIIAGLTAPSAGEVLLDAELTALFQLDVGFREERSGRANAVHSLRLRGFSRAEVSRLLPWIESFSEIGAYFEHPVRTYSLGMRARLAFATMTCAAAGLMIIDEALSVGDARFAQRCARRLTELRAQGRSIITVSHDLQTLALFCDRLIWIDGGQLRADGAPGEIITRYREHCVELDARHLDWRRERDRSASDGGTLSLHTLDASGCERRSLNALEPAFLALRLTEPATSDARIELRLRNHDGQDVLVERATLPKGKREARLCIDELRLGQGKYRVLATLSDAKGARLPGSSARTEFAIEAPWDTPFPKLMYHPLSMRHRGTQPSPSSSGSG